MICCAGNSENFSFAKPIGVGLVEAAIGATLLAKDSKEPLIFVGTAGSYDPRLAAVGTVVYVRTAYQLELRGESPFLQKVKVDTPDIVSRETKWRECNSSSYITTNKKDALKFASFGLAVENMELFSVLSVARQFNLQALGILYITNLCDKNARVDYLKNLPLATKVLHNVVNF